jgi:hypothetical protein
MIEDIRGRIDYQDSGTGPTVTGSKAIYMPRCATGCMPLDAAQREIG